MDRRSRAVLARRRRGARAHRALHRHRVDTSNDTGFTVELDTGEEFEVPADRSILEVLEDNGIEVFKSCEEGICGSCVSGVARGHSRPPRQLPLRRRQGRRQPDRALRLPGPSEKLVIELY